MSLFGRTYLQLTTAVSIVFYERDLAAAAIEKWLKSSSE
jgi:hypothetical protein